MHLVAFPPYLSRLPYDRAASAFIIYLSWTSPVAGFDPFVRDISFKQPAPRRSGGFRVREGMHRYILYMNILYFSYKKGCIIGA